MSGLRALCPLLLAAALTGAAQQPNTGSEAARFLRSGTEEARRGDLPAAAADLRSAVGLDPASFAGWYELGLLLGQMADFRGAEAAFRRAVELKRDSAQAHYNLGLTLIAHPESKLDWPSAIGEFREALKYSPDYAEALNLLGAGLTSTGKNDVAIPQLEHAVRSKPSLAEAHFNLAISLEQAERLPEAEREYRSAAAAKGDYPEATAALGKLLLRMGKPDLAEQELGRSLRLNPDLADAHYALARVLQSLGRKKEAAGEFDIAKDLARRKTDAMESARLSNQGLELAAKGDLAGGMAALRRAVVLKPDYGVPHYNMGLLLADSGDTAAAVQELIKATSLMPGEPKPWYNLGRVLYRNGDRAGALAAMSWAARLSPSDAAIRTELSSLADAATPESKPEPRRPGFGPKADTASGHIEFAAELRAKGDMLGVAGELLKALALEPGQADARLELANAWGRVGEKGRGVVEYRKLLRVRAEDGGTHLQFGKLLMEQGDAESAREEAGAALRYRPDDPEARALLKRATAAIPKP